MKNLKGLKGLGVTVTALDIKRGEPESGCNCPVARAIRRAANLSPKSIVVDKDEVYIISHEVSFNLPKQARTFIDRFDTDKSVEPFTFKIGSKGEFRQ